MNKRIHTICNAHIDPVWLWDKAEGIGAAVSTFRQAVKFCREYDGFVFNHNEALLYKYIKEYDPGLFSEIAEEVRRGHWNIMGGWYLQPDCNMPCGESFVRQILLGRKMFSEYFGISDFKTAVNLDPFGHSAGLCQIMNKAGYENYIITRPAKLDDVGYIKGKTIEWHGACDSKMLVYLSVAYSSSVGKIASAADYQLKYQAGKNVRCLLWGVGDHGGGPSRIDIEELRKIAASSDDSYINSTPDAFFEDYRKNEKPDMIYDKSLRSFAVGCYTTMSQIKKANRTLETLLLTAEKVMSAATAASLTDYPDMTSAWEDLMFLQFHDSLPGTSIQKVENDMQSLAGRGISYASDMITKGFFLLCAGQKAPAEGETPVLVLNPYPYEITEDIVCEYMLPEQNRKEGEFTVADVYDENGNAVLSQNEKELSNIPIDWAKRVVFRAALAPMSVSRFNIRNRVTVGNHFDFSEIKDFVFKCSDKTVKINKNTGLIDSISVSGREYLGGGIKLLSMLDNFDPWAARVTGFRELAGEFRLATPENTARICAVSAETLPPVRVIENGSVRTVVEAIFTCGRSHLVARYILPKHGRLISLSLRVFSAEPHRMLKLSFPTVLRDGTYTVETAYMREELPADGREVTNQRWVMLSSGDDSFAVINKSSYGSDCLDGEIRMSLLRTASYSADPIEERTVLMQDRFTEHIDLGERTFEFSIDCGKTEDISENIGYSASVTAHSPVALSYNPPTGGKKPLPFCSVSDRAIELVTSYKAGGDFIVRLYNSSVKNKTADIAFPSLGLSGTFAFKPSEIVTLICGNGKITVSDKLV